MIANILPSIEDHFGYGNCKHQCIHQYGYIYMHMCAYNVLCTILWLGQKLRFSSDSKMRFFGVYVSIVIS